MNHSKNVVYFLRGGDNRKLNDAQKLQIFDALKKQWFGKSFYVYNQY